jgi:acyl transferase domain-containing protein
VSNGVSNGTRGTNGHVTNTEAQNPLGMPIAICGMGMRLPGGIRHESDLYAFLIGKRDARTTMPQSRYDVDAYYSEHGKAGHIKSRHGYFLDDVDLTKLDLSMFSMTAAEATVVDPAQRLLLEVVREALESAGESDFRGKNIGTYAGTFSDDWSDLQNRDLLNEQGSYQITGNFDFMMGNRIAYDSPTILHESI